MNRAKKATTTPTKESQANWKYRIPPSPPQRSRPKILKCAHTLATIRNTHSVSGGRNREFSPHISVGPLSFPSCKQAGLTPPPTHHFTPGKESFSRAHTQTIIGHNRRLKFASPQAERREPKRKSFSYRMFDEKRVQREASLECSTRSVWARARARSCVWAREHASTRVRCEIVCTVLSVKRCELFTRE